MSKWIVEFHPGAEKDLLEGFEWYAERNSESRAFTLRNPNHESDVEQSRWFDPQVWAVKFSLAIAYSVWRCRPLESKYSYRDRLAALASRVHHRFPDQLRLMQQT